MSLGCKIVVIKGKIICFTLTIHLFIKIFGYMFTNLSLTLGVTLGGKFIVVGGDELINTEFIYN